MTEKTNYTREQKLELFLKEVIAMRNHQRNWFKNHRRKDLIAAKSAESVVDRLIVKLDK